MIQYRPFLNFDTPHLVNIWRQQAPFRGLYKAITRDLLDLQVFAKPYFEREGLVIAYRQGPTASDTDIQPLGFVHAGFAPVDELNDLDFRRGVLAQLKVLPGENQHEVAAGLIQRAIDYLRDRGATEVHAGSRFPHSPFYLGLYGGSRVPGVIAEDRCALQSLQRAGFREIDTVLMLERRLADFRPSVDRQQLALRRKYQLQAIADPLEGNWWECCQFSMAERERFNLMNKSDRGNSREIIGSVSFWDMQPLASEIGGTARGLYDLHVDAKTRRSGLATFMVSESLKQLANQGVGRVEVQIPQSDPIVGRLFNKLGFVEISRGYQMSLKISDQP